MPHGFSIATTRFRLEAIYILSFRDHAIAIPDMFPKVQRRTDWTTRDQKLFDSLLVAYEQKELVQAKKLADNLIKKYPHGVDALCMKGIILVHLGDRKEGVKLVETGKNKDPTSEIAWHVWAMIQRGEHNYEEAVKAYEKALANHNAPTNPKGNLNILREISTLYTQLRRYDDLLETRYTILRSHSTVRGHWIALALAYRLNGRLEDANSLLGSMDGFMRKVPKGDPEYGELIIFRVRILEELGRLKEAFLLLDLKLTNKQLVARSLTSEYKARLLSKLKSTDAEKEWEALINQNPNCYDYYKGFLANRGIDLEKLTDETRQDALEILQKYSEEHPKTNAPRRLALTVAEGRRFEELVGPYIEAALQKGIPSLFSDLKSLYSDPSKRQSIQAIAEKKKLKLKPEPTYYLWTLYFLAQHHSFLGQQCESLAILEDALSHTPTLPELYMTKARVLKRAGDPYGAVSAMEEARQLDGQDRYINTKCGKYYLRAGMVEKAEAVLGLFTKKDSTPSQDLTEMQALHFLKEAGDAQRRNGKLNLALKKYYAIQDVFKHFHDDQYDFHQYAVRTTGLNPYIALIRWEDTLKSHPTYIHAAVSIAQIWVKLHDDRAKGKKPQAELILSKKQLNKIKKLSYKKNPILPDPKQKNGEISDHGLDVMDTDPDPDGFKLVRAEDPLERATKVLQTLEDVRDNVNVCLAVFDVAIRREKYLQAARALRRIRAVDSHHPELHLRVVQLCKAVMSLDGSTRTVLKPILEETLAELKPPEVSLEVFNSQYLQLHSASAKAILACAKVLRDLEHSQEDVENLLFTGLTPSADKLQIEDACAILSYMREIDCKRANEFRSACKSKYMHSKLFEDANGQVGFGEEGLEVGGGEEEDNGRLHSSGVFYE
ncbi:NMDA receptor-regulated protein 1-domain-containing protein [Phlebopus sp. FC_14]|nr:NMDA receptor-regulated protein 1-domain-containing protein [Phlebopus sp. FC_14]